MQLAEKTVISRKAIGRWERDRTVPTGAEWRRVAAVLGIPEMPPVVRN
jgi:transcriptional regulator with XRE-family HTH domain